jgi:hypothetical protein
MVLACFIFALKCSCEVIVGISQLGHVGMPLRMPGEPWRVISAASWSIELVP